MPPDLRIALAADPAGGWQVIGYLGSYHDDRYGDFAITREMVESWRRNLSAGAVTGQPNMLGLDWDHSSESTGSTRACGWLREIKLDGDRILGLVEWTPAARAAIEAGEYKFFSPTFSSHFNDDQGRDIGDVLLGGALTNKPFLRSKGTMAVSLSRLEASALEQLRAALAQRGVGLTDALFRAISSIVLVERKRSILLIVHGSLTMVPPNDRSATRAGGPCSS